MKARHLFDLCSRLEAGRMVSNLTRILGPEHLACRTTRAPGSFRPPGTAPWMPCAGDGSLARKEKEIALPGELYARAGDPERAAASYRKALALVSPQPVRRLIRERLERLEG